MKRFLKWSLIFGIICCLVGIGTITAGAMMGGRIHLEKGLHQAVMDGQARLRSQIDRQDIADGAALAEGEPDGGETWSIPGTEDYPLVSSYSYSGVRKLDVEMLSNCIELREGDEETGDSIIIEHTENSGTAYKIRQNGDKLELKMDDKEGKHLSGGSGMESLLIYVPRGYIFDELKVENDMGNFQADTLHVGKLSLECNAGEISVGGGTVQSLDIECNGGSISCLAAADRDAEVECDAGTVEITLAGVLENYDYDMECDIGQILINGEEMHEYSGLHKDHHLNHHAAHSVDLECHAGSIVVNFSGTTM